MNAMGHLQSKFKGHHDNFARDPLRSYYDEPQKKMKLKFVSNQILHYFQAYSVKFMKYVSVKYAINRHKLNSDCYNEDVCLPMMSLKDIVLLLIDVHGSMNKFF